MEEAVVSRKSILIVVLFSLIVSGVIFFKNYLFDNSFIVFCDVGQGDATYIRLPNGFDVMVDVGPDRKVLSCLGKFMPFYDKTIELVFISHPQKDHFGGFDEVLNRYKVKNIFMNLVNNKSSSYSSLLNKINNKKILIKKFTTGDKIIIYNAKFLSLWPNKIFEMGIKDLNKISIVIEFTINNKKILFTGDVDKKTLESLINILSKVNILKVPHHGSKNSLSKKFYYKINPDISIIHVGKNNSYGLPSQDVLKILKQIKSDVKRTDKEGNIKINL